MRVKKPQNTRELSEHIMDPGFPELPGLIPPNADHPNSYIAPGENGEPDIYIPPPVAPE